MSLPKLPAGDKYRREVRTEWGGINLNENAGDGELIEAMNMSSREFPLLANARFTKTQGTDYYLAVYPYGGQLGYEYRIADAIWLHDPTPGREDLLLGTIPGTNVTKQFAILGDRMCLFSEPLLNGGQDKQVYYFKYGATEPMESVYTLEMQAEDEAIAMDGTYDGVPAAGNTIYLPGADWINRFSVGDAVTISGFWDQHNNKTAVIREIDEDYLRFDENTFEPEVLRGLYRITVGNIAVNQKLYFEIEDVAYQWENNSGADIPMGSWLEVSYAAGLGYIVDYRDAGVAFTATATQNPTGYRQVYSHVTFSVGRLVPDLDYVCVNENRVWGCKGDTIYCSKLGDPLNWNVYQDLSTDSWSVETGTPGDFTGCASFQGYPTFFKENCVFKVLGDTPQNFTLRKVNIMGVKDGAYKTVVEIRGRLYYLSHAGVMEWNGGDYPSIISGVLGIEPGAVSEYGSLGAGTDSLRYYIELMPEVYQRQVDAFIPQMGVYVYDTRYGTWHFLSDEGGGYRTVMFAGDGVYNWMIKDYALSPGGNVPLPTIYALHDFNPSKDTTTDWAVTFADSTRAYKTALAGSESKKAVLRLLIRCRLAGSMKVWIAYDGGDFEQAGEFGGEDGMAKNSRVVPLILRRCDFWQLRLTGVGDAVIYSIAVERYGGEWQQA